MQGSQNWWQSLNLAPRSVVDSSYSFLDHFTRFMSNQASKETEKILILKSLRVISKIEKRPTNDAIPVDSSAFLLHVWATLARDCQLANHNPSSNHPAKFLLHVGTQLWHLTELSTHHLTCSSVPFLQLTRTGPIKCGIEIFRNVCCIPYQ